MWGEGTVLAGRYQLRQRIGGGSMGDVWRALDTVLGREVAVKILLPALLDDAGFAARFHTEARVLAALSHPGIVSVFDYGEADDPRTAFLVMELIAGRPLSDLLDESAPLSEATTLTIVAQTLEALQAAHDRGIVHRDVKPANLMLRGGSVVVTDFGVARTADARRLTAADVVLGTAVYAAPEQARHTAVTAAADQYAVGVIAYECLTGSPPFDGGTPLGIMMKHLQEPVPPLPDTVSAPVRDLVMRALAKDPAERFASAREMAETARRLAARSESLTRIGTPQDSFQTGVDVAAVEAAAAIAEAARGDGDFLSFTVVPRDDAEEAEAAGDAEADGEVPGAAGAAGGTGDGGAAKAGTGAGIGIGIGIGAEGSPAWASYAIRPQAEGTDWASFTVRGPADGTEPLPSGETTADVEPPAEPEPKAEERAGAGRVVPQDSFMAGVDRDAEGLPAQQSAPATEVGKPARAGFGARWRKRNATEQKEQQGQKEQQEARTIGEPESTGRQAAAAEPTGQQAAAAELTGQQAAAAEPTEQQAIATEPSDQHAIAAEPTDSSAPGEALDAGAAPEPESEPEPELEPDSEAEPDPTPAPAPAPDPDPDLPPRIAAGHAMPLNSFNAGVDLDPVEEAPAGRVVPQDSFTVGVVPESGGSGDSGDSDRSGGPGSFTIVGPAGAEEASGPREAGPGRRRAIVLAAVGVAAVVAIAVAYPLAHGGSHASAASGAPVGVASATSASGGVSTSDVSVTSVVSETSTIVVTSASSVHGKPVATSAAPPASVGGKPVPTSGSGSALTSRPPVSATSSAAVPPPTTPSSPAVPHKSGYITNVGDGDAIDVFGNSSGSPLFADGSSLTVEPQAGRAGQSFQATALTSNGQAVYEFGDGLNTSQLIDATGGKVTLSHCSCGSVFQMWWLSQDSSTPSGAFYINSQGAAGQCLTDSGQTNALALKPCVAGDKAQEWFLP
ncbi:tRNA A-37 threonylcarbamoyl transferase component Bud32 [Catenulispora sp. MAP5-51]|uniref:protein kinase domain-containing protein n=1 Tax=Catenulispora sp. MAP5-51 TaxID=3156298 RepID=UPI003513974A